MSGLGDFFGESKIAEQLLIWGVLNQVISALGAPYFAELQSLSNSATPLTPLQPADLAGMVARGLAELGYGRDQSRQSGIDDGDFDHLVDAARRGPDISMVFELLRRGKIGMGGSSPTETSVGGALTDAGVRPEWHALVAELAVSIPDQAQVLNAWLEGQIDAGEAHTRLLKAGMDPSWIETAYNTNGQAPTPMEALEMLNRGLIPEGGTGPGVVSYDQAFLEGPWRNKWLRAFKGLREYFPPPRTVTAMFHEGSMDHAEAAGYLAKQGLPAGLITKYLAAAHHTKVEAEKHLAKGDVLALYHDKLINKAQATSALVALKYTAIDAGYLLALTDMRATTAQLNSAVTKVRALYLAGKMTETQARSTLVELKVPADQTAAVVAVWKLEATKHVRTLTPAQVEDAFKLKLLSQSEAEAELVKMGYTRFDAWMLLSIKAKEPLPNRPPIDF